MKRTGIRRGIRTNGTIKYCNMCEDAKRNDYISHTGKPYFKGCKNSHGKCNVCSDWKNTARPFFATGVDQWITGSKAWTKQKGTRKQLANWLKKETNIPL